VIKNAVIHFSGRLPLLADLRGLPGANDTSVLASNLRTRDGKRPTFAEEPGSWFLIPLREVFVIELPAGAEVNELLAPSTPGAATAATGAMTATSGTEMAAPTSDTAAPAAARSEMALVRVEAAAETTPLEPDEDLLARIRQV
jgi:hypothetical protein